MEKQLHLNLLASRPPMAGGLQSGAKMRMGPGRKRDFSPLPWSQYFETMEDVEVENENTHFLVIQSSIALPCPISPVQPLTPLHTFRLYGSGAHGPVLLLLHGGGHSALSWAVFTGVICSRINCRVVAMDLRAHGKDVGKVVEALYANHIPSLLGLCVIDVVEGTAMDALNSMQNFLRSRPKTFKSVENAIEWSVKSGQIRNIESARVSMVGQVKKCEEPMVSPGISKSISEGIIEEEEEDEEGSESNHKRKKEDDQEAKKESVYTWRIELSKTEKYWDGWFRGLSSLFLSCPVPKLLLLAGIDRLDKDLTIGQMQGKFQMQVLPQCGHAVHEDAPEKVADALATFMVRHKFTQFKEGFPW
uniref:Protein phosphatase methylesterase 1 n=1 Tax=Electrophorus electricus TaxID=8005 RepID=A0A4W4EEY0_ELEEL